MYPKDSDFFLRSKQIAEKFLQTTVIVDDQAEFDFKSPPTELTPTVSTDLKKPGRIPQGKPNTDLLAKSDKTGDTSVMPSKGSHALDAQKVINSFAQKRIVCSIIKPSKDLDWQKAVIELAYSADIIIFDWELDRDNGEKTLSVLKKILQAAIDTPAQLRLFAIYTGEPGIVGVATKIKKLMATQMRIAEEKILEQDNGFSLSYQSIRIVIFSKPGTTGLPTDYDERKIEFDKLADRVTTEFTIMTAGLVSNVAINSLALVRNNTHKFLNRFSAHLDAPYLTHRALQVIPEDAEDLLSELVAEEFRAILEEESISKAANLEMITLWLSAAHDGKFTIPFKKEVSLTANDVLNLLSNGIKGIEECKHIPSNVRDKPHKIPLTKMFKPPWVNGDDLDEKFSLLTTFQTHYQKARPRLTFGSILQAVKDKQYLVCIQPRCDSVRIDTERVFPMLPLEIREAEQKFRMVLLDENAINVRVSLKDKPYSLRLINFASRDDDHGTIVARFKKGYFFFTGTNKAQYRWVGQLRVEQAQRLANEFAANLSRVGLDESEWLRLWATKG
jgi:hypothetical protein